MQRGKSVLRWTGVVVALAVALLGVNAWGISGAPAAPDKSRADIVTIDAMKVYGKLELAPVTFLHDKHTDELAKAARSRATLSCRWPATLGDVASPQIRSTSARPSSSPGDDGPAPWSAASRSRRRRRSASRIRLSAIVRSQARKAPSPRGSKPPTRSWAWAGNSTR